MWLDIVLIVAIVIFAVIGIFRGFIDSVLSIFSSLVSLVISYFLAKYVATLLNKLFSINGMFDKMLGSWGINEGGMMGIARQKIASCITFLLSMLIVWILLKIAIWLLSKLFSSITANSKTLSGINRALGFLFGAVKGVIFVAVMLCAISLLNSFGLNPPDRFIRDHTTVTAAVYKYLDPWVKENVAGMVKDWADKITGDDSKDNDADGDTSESTNTAIENVSNVIIELSSGGKVEYVAME